ncbi:glycosyltransferase family 39 protein [uncultured Lutibacter sp.]|uniref:ArnT family glycosyltransferase n=1 Tax=uncultured Lutibacter sp. TaxID=437739 RepID=UPI0026246EB2|nr:glycosyltransferase family 39 protein [uncultured Lutibacter sp.]
MIEKIEKYPLASLSITIILMLLVHLNIPEITIMEARNFITAREMINDNHWLLTTMNGEPRYQKPPLPTWITAISGVIFGVNNLHALRLPAALMVLFIGIFSYYFSLKLKLTKNHSFRNSLILVTSFYVFAIINEAPWDIFAHGFMLAGLYFLFLLLKEPKPTWKNVIASSVFIGFSIMSKGPVSLFALLLPFIISYSIVYKFKKIKSKFLQLVTLLLTSLIVGGWWFLYVRLIDPAAFLEIASKETGNWSSYNVKPIYYYWSFFTQTGLWTIPAFISLMYPYLIKRVDNKKAYQFSFWWTISAVILLSLIPEKKARYLMPVLIPLALNTGFYIQYLIKSFYKLKLKIDKIPVYFNFGLIATIGISIPFALFFVLNDRFQNHISSFILTSVFSIVIGVLIFMFLIKKKFKHVFYLNVLFMVGLFLFGLPISKGFNKNEAYNSIKKLHQIEFQHKITTYSIGEITPELLWDYNGPLKNIYKNKELNIPSEEHFGLLIMNENINEIFALLEPEHHIKLTDTYNLNTGSKSKERLIRKFYIVSKK